MQPALRPRRALLGEPWIAAVFWALVALLVRAWWLRHHPAVVGWDGILYHRTAARIARGLGYVDSWNDQAPYRPAGFYPVGYPALLGAAYALAGARAAVAGALNALAAAVTALLTTRMAQRAYGPLSAHAAGALFALAPGSVAYTSALMTETISGALLCASLYFALRHARCALARHAFASGALLGVSALVRPPSLTLWPLLALAAAPRARRGEIARSAALILVSCAALVLPWTARNCARLDGCALVSTNGGSNLWIGTDPAADGGYRVVPPTGGCAAVRGQVHQDRCFARLALANIRRDPLTWLALAPRKVRQLLDYEGAPVWYLRDAPGARPIARAHDAARWMTAYHRALLALALFSLVPLGARRSMPREASCALAIVTVSVAVHVVFFGSDRYHLVFTPLLCLLASSALRRSTQNHDQSGSQRDHDLRDAATHKSTSCMASLPEVAE